MANTHHIGPPSGDFILRKHVLESLISQVGRLDINSDGALNAITAKSDSAQAHVIVSTARTIRVVAPAGSGKTQTIINRALKKISDGTSADRMLLLTFDNAAAFSLRSKLAERVDQLSASDASFVQAERLQIQTLNAFGFGLLRAFFPEEHNTLVERPRMRAMIKAVKNDLRHHYGDFHNALPRNLRDTFYLDVIRLLKNRLLDPRDFQDQECGELLLSLPQAQPLFPAINDPHLVAQTVGAICWIHRSYEQRLNQSSSIDFDDQKLRAYRRLAADPLTSGMVQKRYDEIIVDEFQDINQLDFALISLIARESSLVVTGDDDQAIYGFRGCSPEYIINLDKLLGRSIQSYELDINYRCPRNIVFAADQLISRNTFRIPKSPTPWQTRDSQISIIASQSTAVEAKSTIAYIRHLKEQARELRLKEIAILYRTNSQSFPLQLELILNDIPYLVRDEDNILQNDVFRSLVGILHLKRDLAVAQTSSIESQISAVRGFHPYVESWKWNKIRDILLNNRSFLTAIRSQEFLHLLPGTSKNNFGDAVQTLIACNDLVPALELLRDHWKGLRESFGSLEEVMSRTVTLSDFCDFAEDFDNNTERFTATLDQALRHAEQNRTGRDNEGITLSTCFRAKGRQWHTVILIGCNEGIFPLRGAPIEDERRLFYVAMTRTSANLVISYLTDAYRVKLQPSRFLNEAGLLEANRSPQTLSQGSSSTSSVPWYRSRSESTADALKEERPDVGPPSELDERHDSSTPWYRKQNDRK